MILRFGPLIALLLGLPACSAQGLPSPPAADVTATDSVQVRFSPPAAPQTAPATDGGSIALPKSQVTRLIAQDSLWAEALRIHYNAIVMDGHVDVPSLMMADYDVGMRHDTAHVDIPRMIEGGLDAPFFSIYVAAGIPEGARATQYAKWMIQEVERQVRRNGDKVELATTADEVRRITAAGKKAILLGLEGGHGLGGSVEALRELRKMGIRYVTLTHVNSNSWSDSSQDAPRWNGLNDLGRELVREMNRLGVLVDVSHVSDSTFWDALAVSEAPLIASHSSCRAWVNNVRNLSDDMIRGIASRGGVVLINYFDLVVNPGLTEEVMTEVYRRIRASGSRNLWSLWDTIYSVRAERGIPRATLEDVVDHIDHVAQLVGVDYVGLGSDFDGANMPTGLEDVTRLPWITHGLLKRGYSEDDLYKILGGNVLRVLEAADRAAARLSAP